MEDYTQYKLSDTEHHGRLIKQIAKIGKRTVPCLQPTILIISGQPGCGKTSMTELLKQKIFIDPSKETEINGDDYRALHPKSMEIFRSKGKDYAKYTDPDARLWTSELLEWASDNNRNIIFESTLRQPEPINTTIKGLKAKGYSVIIAVMSVPYEISKTNIVLRYENSLRIKGGIARWTDIKSHDEAYKNIPETVDFLEKNNTAIDKLYILKYEVTNEINIIYPDKQFNTAKEALNQTRLSFSAKERQMNYQNQLKILKLMKHRNATEQEIRQFHKIFTHKKTLGELER